MGVYALRGLTVRHGGAAVLQDVALDIAAGEQIALIGPSGAGKTTLLHVLALAQRPTTGALQLGATDPWALPQAARHQLRARLFLAPQTPPLPPRQRVVTSVLAARLPHWSLGRALKNLFAPEDPQAAWEALQRFQLGDKLYARVDRLSGGERQRTGLARLLLSSADILLADEPLSALDPTLAALTLNTLQQEAAQRKAALVCSLHQVDLARAHFVRIIGLRDGRVQFDAPREAVSDAMIAALYQNAAAGSAQAPELPHGAKVDGCF